MAAPQTSVVMVINGWTLHPFCVMWFINGLHLMFKVVLG